MPTEQQIADIIRAVQAAFGDSAKKEVTVEKTEEIVETPEKTEEIIETPEKTEEIIETPEKTEEIIETPEMPETVNDITKIIEKLIDIDEKIEELHKVVVKMTTPPSVPYIIDSYEYSEKSAVEMPADEKLRAATQTIMRGY